MRSAILCGGNLSHEKDPFNASICKHLQASACIGGPASRAYALLSLTDVVCRGVHRLPAGQGPRGHVRNDGGGAAPALPDAVRRHLNAALRLHLHRLRVQGAQLAAPVLLWRRACTTAAAAAARHAQISSVQTLQLWSTT